MSDIINSVVAGYEQGLSDVRTTDEPRVMLMLGDFEFSIDTATYNQLTREASWRWGEQERIGKADLLQYTGKSARSVKIEGEAHALFRNGVDAINDLYLLADKAEPQQLVSGAGDVLGWWVIMDFNDANTSFLPSGAPRKKTYSMTIKHYADDISNP
ncbi:TPA: phage tail protein [Serratia odorifera]|uniref:phage tail protein n=1 Tax=Serratia odorifera TaxID=618 RepID=UPI0023628786|nr:phage tail protein [Serratia odorifera]